MRVLIQTELYPPLVAGEGAFARGLAQGLVRRGHDVLVVTAALDGDAGRERDGPVDVLRLRSVRNPAYDTFRIAVPPFGDLVRALAVFRPDVVQLNNPGPSGWAVLRWARRHGIRCLSTHHFLPTTAGWNRRLLRPVAPWVERALWVPLMQVHNRADAVTAPSRFALRTLRRRGLRRPGHVVSNGVDLDRFHPRKRDRTVLGLWNVPAQARVVLHLGRLYPSKRCDVLLRGLACAPEDTWLLVCGGGPDLPRLRRLASPHVIFTGPVADIVLPALYASADAFAIASAEELQGIVVLESLASGTPVVAADAGALPELVRPGETGALFPPGDALALARQLRSVLAHRERYAAHCRKRAESHGIEHTLDRISTLLVG